MSNILKLYSNPANPGAFRGITGFIENNKTLDKKLIKKELLKTPAYTT